MMYVFHARELCGKEEEEEEEGMQVMGRWACGVLFVSSCV